MGEKSTFQETENQVLSRNEKMLSQIIQGSSIPTFVIDKNHVVTHYNKACENLTGIRASEMIGTKNQWRAFYSEKRPVMADLIVDGVIEKEYEKYYRGRYRKSTVIQNAYEAEGFFAHLGENGKWLFFTAAPLKDTEGSVIGAIETLQDITDRKHAETVHRESAKRLRTLLDFIPYPIVVFNTEGHVNYLNPAFTEIFGWTLEELEGQHIPFLPEGLEKETRENLKKLLKERVIYRYETRRLTKDGRVLDVLLRAGIFSETRDQPSGVLVIMRDISQEKRMARQNEAILRISLALPEYPDLEDLLDYISNEVKRLMDTEGALVIMLDEQKNELFFMGAAYDDSDTEKRVKEVRFAMDELMAGRVIRSGEPVIVEDASDQQIFPDRDKKLGYRTRNFAEAPIKSNERIIGVLAALNKREGRFDQTDIELLSMIAGTVGLSIENARYSGELKKAYQEVSSLNRAKDKVINHLSHELKTPISVLSGSLNVLEKKLSALKDLSWTPTMKRVRRNLERITDIQEEVDDIVRAKQYQTYDLISPIVEECIKEIKDVVTCDAVSQSQIDTVRKRLEQKFGPRFMPPKTIRLGAFIQERLDTLRPHYEHRRVDVVSRLDPNISTHIPQEALRKVVDGLIKNAVENTPDMGRIDIEVKSDNRGVHLIVHDFGVGITQENQSRIFDGFFSTQDTMAYSSKRAFDFNAGGKGADLLRMKIFSERFGFKIGFESERCRHIPLSTDVCPGCIDDCSFCETNADCLDSGFTRFHIIFAHIDKDNPSPQ